MPNFAHVNQQNPIKKDLIQRFSTSGIRRQSIRHTIRHTAWQITRSGLQKMGRITEGSMALFLMFVCFLSPLGLCAFLYAIFQKKPIQKTLRMGRWGQHFYEYRLTLPKGWVGRLCRAFYIHRIPALWNIIKGDMAFIGPRPTSPQEMSLRERAVRKRSQVRPGLICLWWIRRRANIAYEVELDVDEEYVDTHTTKGDLGIVLRAIPVALYGDAPQQASEHISILGIPIDNLTMSEAVETIRQQLDKPGGKQVCFVNADCANLSRHDEAYLQVLRNSHLKLADGIGMKLAGKLLGRDIRQNVNGTDLFPRLCEALSETHKRLFLLGGRPGIAKGVCDWIAQNHPNVMVCGYRDGYFTPEEEKDVIAHIAKSKADLLLVALGAPRQDKWIYQHLEQTGAKVAAGVGGLFDFYSGNMPRAPLWMRELCIEWLYRFYQEPRRMWKRYFVGNAVFLFRVFIEKMGWIKFDNSKSEHAVNHFDTAIKTGKRRSALKQTNQEKEGTLL